jgi:hypothetical protein
MTVPDTNTAVGLASTAPVIEYATIKACGIPMHSRDFIGGSYMVGQPATENFDRHKPWTISVAS